MKTTRVRIALALAAGAVLLAGCDKSASASDTQLAGCTRGHAHPWAALADPGTADPADPMPPMAQVLTVEDTTYESETGALVHIVTRRSQIVRLLPDDVPDWLPIEPAEEVQKPHEPQAGGNLRLTVSTDKDNVPAAAQRHAERKQIP